MLMNQLVRALATAACSVLLFTSSSLADPPHDSRSTKPHEVPKTWSLPDGVKCDAKSLEIILRGLEVQGKGRSKHIWDKSKRLRLKTVQIHSRGDRVLREDEAIIDWNPGGESRFTAVVVKPERMSRKFNDQRRLSYNESYFSALGLPIPQNVDRPEPPPEYAWIPRREEVVADYILDANGVRDRSTNARVDIEMSNRVRATFELAVAEFSEESSFVSMFNKLRSGSNIEYVGARSTADYWNAPDLIYGADLSVAATADIDIKLDVKKIDVVRMAFPGEQSVYVGFDAESGLLVQIGTINEFDGQKHAAVTTMMKWEQICDIMWIPTIRHSVADHGRSRSHEFMEYVIFGDDNTAESGSSGSKLK